MKKTFISSLIVVVIFIMSVLPYSTLKEDFNLKINANNDIYIYNNELYYSFINPNEIIINGCVDDTKSIYNIPGDIDGIPVVGIASGAFCNLNNLTAVTFWPGNMFIEENAFVNCPSLRCIMVGNWIKSIEAGNFDGCPKLIIFGLSGTAVANYATDKGIRFIAQDVMEGNIEYNGFYYAFSNYYLLDRIVVNGYIDKSVKHLEIPAEIEGLPVIEIGGEAFGWFRSLTSVKIPDSVTCINMGAFAGCSSLTSIILPDSVMFIGEEAFNNPSLTSIVIPKSVIRIDKSAFWGANNVTIYGYSGSYAETYAFENDIPFVALDEEPTLLGDVNGDSEINVVDVIYLAKAIANRITLIDEQIVNANIDGVSGVSSDNLILLIKYLIGEIETLSIFKK